MDCYSRQKTLKLSKSPINIENFFAIWRTQIVPLSFGLPLTPSFLPSFDLFQEQKRLEKGPCRFPELKSREEKKCEYDDLLIL
jgi:hypothetical protein